MSQFTAGHPLSHLAAPPTAAVSHYLSLGIGRGRRRLKRKKRKRGRGSFLTGRASRRSIGSCLDEHDKHPVASFTMSLTGAWRGCRCAS